MSLICMPGIARGPGPRACLAGPPIAALCAMVLAAFPAVAQEGGGTGGDVPPATAGSAEGGAKGKAPAGAVLPGRDFQMATPQHAPAGLWRRANVKTLMAKLPNRPAGGLPAANSHLGLSPLQPATAASRNAIGATLPAMRPAVQGAAGVTTQTGNKLTAVGTPVRNGGYAVRQLPIPSNVPAAHGAAAINGTTIGRVAAGSGSIGGPARDRSGINGTTMRPKHY